MTLPLPADVERFRGAVTRHLGLEVEETRMGALAELLRRRAGPGAAAAEDYLLRLERHPNRAELSTLARELTVNETYFFRNNAQFRAFSEICLPDRLRTVAGRRRLRLLSAGCASGEEAYTLAILCKEQVDPASEVSILAVDVNPAVIERAAKARFSAWSLRETPAEQQRRWFRADGRDFILDGTIAAAVRFEEQNLVAPDEPWPAASYDVIFCRNVIMYLSAEHAQAVIARIARALVPGGYLFLGHAETLRGLSHDFHLRHTHETFYYQRRDGTAADAAARGSSSPPTTSATAAAAPPLPPAAPVESADTWVETIRLASQRIQQLTDAPTPAPPPRAAPAQAAPAQTAPTSSRWNLGRAFDLLQRERFADAIELLRALPAASARDPDVLLLHAVLLTHSGQLAAAEAMCETLLELEEHSAGARYVLALCREAAGDRAGAAEHDQVAVYLDPAFAMPRLHLGLLARRGDDRAAARRELGQALLLLRREDPSRLLLFGGGFTRETLIALCRAELSACGGAG